MMEVLKSSMIPLAIKTQLSPSAVIPVVKKGKNMMH